MYKDEYLFLPEAKTVDKLLSVFNIQSKQQLAPNEVISILGLLNVLNLVGIAQEGITSNSLNNLVNTPQAIDNQQLQQVLQQLSNNTSQNNSQNNLLNSLTGMLKNNNQSGSGLDSLLGMLGGNGGNGGSNGNLDPTLMLKLMNLVNQIKESKNNQPEDQSESNKPVKSEPYDREEDDN